MSARWTPTAPARSALLASLLAGAGHGGIGWAGEPAPASPAAVIDRMQTHFRHATDARTAVIDGDLERARQAAAKLAALTELPGLPPEGRPLLAAMTGAAKVVSEAPDLPAAAQAVGRLGAACGDCHRALGRGPAAKLVDLPQQTWTPDAHMHHHAWAADWMWLGLIASSDAAWAKGVAPLAEKPTWEVVEDRPELGNAEILEQQIHLLADKARELTSAPESSARASDPGERAELYGWFLTACSECHTRIRAPGTAPAPVAPPG